MPAAMRFFPLIGIWRHSLQRMPAPPDQGEFTIGTAKEHARGTHAQYQVRHEKSAHPLKGGRALHRRRRLTLARLFSRTVYRAPASKEPQVLRAPSLPSSTAINTDNGSWLNKRLRCVNWSSSRQPCMSAACTAAPHAAPCQPPLHATPASCSRPACQLAAPCTLGRRPAPHRWG
jgi:hypothetical protein